MIRALAVLATVLFAAPVQPFDVISPRKARVHKKVVLVLDASYSMETHLDEAIEALQVLAEQPTDEMELAIYAFATLSKRWPEHGFRKLPDARAVGEFETWLRKTRPVLGTMNTVASPALHRAQLTPGPRTVVFITDGSLYNAIDSAKNLRAMTKEDILVFGIHTKDADKTTLSALAGKTGGYYRMEP